MDKKELYHSVKNRKAYGLFSDLKIELSTTIFDGTNNHSSKSLLSNFSSMVNLYKMGDFPQEETMGELRLRNRELFEHAFDKVQEAVNNYRIKI